MYFNHGPRHLKEPEHVLDDKGTDSKRRRDDTESVTLCYSNGPIDEESEHAEVLDSISNKPQTQETTRGGKSGKCVE